MSRDIKFRAYIKDLAIVIPVQCINFNCATVEVRLDEGDFWELDFEEVELMQFTGRLDINNKEVYESDNIKCKDLYTGLEFTGTVAFQDCSFVIKDDCVTHYRWMDYEVEVIGNIHEPNKQKGGEE